MATVNLETKTVVITGEFEEVKSLGILNPKGSGRTIVITGIIQKNSSIVTSSIFVRRDNTDLVVRGLDQRPITVDETIIAPLTLVSKEGESFFLQEGDELFASVGKSGKTEFKIKYFIFS
jgi:hypothetical protein